MGGGGGGGGGGGQFRAQSVISQTLPIYLDKQYTGWGRGGGGGGGLQFRAQSVISQKLPIYLDKQYTGPLAGSFENKSFSERLFSVK